MYKKEIKVVLVVVPVIMSKPFKYGWMFRI